MNEIWICSDCRSVNGAKQSRCYRCHVPKTTGEMTEATASISVSNAQQTRTVLAQATRMGAHYVSTWPLALLLVPLMVAATWTVYVVLDAYLAAINSDGSLVSDPIVLQHFIDGTIMAGVTLMAALIVWSIWIALVVRNVPALTARWAPNGWLSALLAAWIPFINLRRPHSVVRGVLGTLAVGRPLPILVALAWWVSVLAAYVVPSVAIWFGRSDDRASFSAIVSIQDVLMVVALFFAVAVVVIVEWEQHGALVRRADAVFGEAPAAA